LLNQKKDTMKKNGSGNGTEIKTDTMLTSSAGKSQEGGKRLKKG